MSKGLRFVKQCSVTVFKHKFDFHDIRRVEMTEYLFQNITKKTFVYKK